MSCYNKEMQITKIESQKKAPGRVNVYVDGEFAFGLAEGLFLDYGLYKGKEVTAAEIEKIKEGDDLKKCLDKAYRFLSYRPRSEKEMKDKLLEKYQEPTALKAINKLKEYNLVNDNDFALAWVRSRQKQKGKKVIQLELTKKGIAKEVAAEALKGVTVDSELETAKALVLSKSRFKSLTKDEAFRKVSTFLGGRGYSYEVIKKIIKELYEQ